MCTILIACGAYQDVVYPYQKYIVIVLFMHKKQTGHNAEKCNG